VYSNRWSPGLRQGDVLADVLFPALAASIQIQTTVSSFAATAKPEPGGRIVVPAEKKFAVVISHCCEFNEGKTNRMLLARLERPPGNLTQEQLVDLRGANDYRARLAEGAEKVAGVDWFVFEQLSGTFEDEMVVSFSSATPFPMKLKDTFAEMKRAELDHDVRLLFRAKLAWFVAGRDSKDIDDALKVDRPELPPLSA
jgi:hypothetical protein